MKLYRKFPIQDFVEVPIEGMGSVRVKYKFPTVAQERLFTNYDIDICLFCIEELPDIEDENGPVKWELKYVKGVGYELPEDILGLLLGARIHTALATFYLKNIRPSDLKKKSES